MAGGKKGEEKYDAAWQHFFDGIEIDRFGSQPDATVHTKRENGQISKAEGTGKQESKHKHSQKAFGGRMHGLRTSNVSAWG